MLLTHLTKSETAFMQISGVFVHSLHLLADNFNFHWDFFSCNFDFFLYNVFFDKTQLQLCTETMVYHLFYS